MSENILGKPVSEEEVAKGLGFADVYELRRWQTNTGNKVVELEHALSQARDEARRFQWSGRRMQIVLEEAEKMIRGIWEALGGQQSRYHYIRKLLLAVGVVCGRGVDWENELDDWFKPVATQMVNQSDESPSAFLSQVVELDRLRAGISKLVDAWRQNELDMRSDPKSYRNSDYRELLLQCAQELEDTLRNK